MGVSCALRLLLLPLTSARSMLWSLGVGSQPCVFINSPPMQPPGGQARPSTAKRWPKAAGSQGNGVELRIREPLCEILVRAHHCDALACGNGQICLRFIRKFGIVHYVLRVVSCS